MFILYIRKQRNKAVSKSVVAAASSSIIVL